MHKIINASGATILRGRIVKHSFTSVPVCPQLVGGAPISKRTGFPNLYPSATGRITATCASLAACKLWLRGPGVLSSDLLNLSAGTSTSTTRNTFTVPLIDVHSDIDPVGTIDLAMVIDDSVTQCVSKDSAVYAVTALDLLDKAISQAFIEGDYALVEYAETSLIVGKYLCSDASGKARYYDAVSDRGAITIGQIDEETTIQTISGKNYIGIVLSLSPT